MSSNLVKKFYQDVVEQVFQQSSVLWEEEGLEDASMTDLRQLWESKLLEAGMDLSRDGAGQDHHEPAPSKASGRSNAKSKNNQNNASVTASTNSGRKARSSPQTEPQQQQTSSLPQPQPQSQHPQLAPLQYQTSEQQQQQQQQQHIRQQNASLQSQQNSNLQSQQPGRPAQVVANHGQNPSSAVPTISLLPYSVPISGPLVHISSSQVPNANAMSGLVQRQQLQHNQPGNAPTMVVGPNGIQQLLLGNPGSQLRNAGNMSQIISQQHQNQRQSMVPVEDRSQLLEHFRLQMQRNQQQQNALMINRIQPIQQDIPQKFRQQNGVITGNQQFAQLQNHNGNGLFAMGNQFPFQQPGVGGGQSSVIHVADSSGNQSALQLPVIHAGNDNLNNIGNSGNRGGNIRKPGQSLPLQLDGGDDDDDDDDDDDAFQDLSDDDAPAKSTPRPAKKQKTGDRRDLSERLEEEDLDSEDDDDNDDNTASVVDVIDNVVVCQYEKISRTRNKWKLHLKSGMCSLNGKEYIFHKAAGDAEF